MGEVKEIPRDDEGKFLKGVSGNPMGRPKGSKNKITLLKQSLELQLREQASPDMGKVLDKAIELALEGHPGMIKLLLEMHMSKGAAEDVKASEKVAIQINSLGEPQLKHTTTIDGEVSDETDE